MRNSNCNSELIFQLKKKEEKKLTHPLKFKHRRIWLFIDCGIQNFTNS